MVADLATQFELLQADVHQPILASIFFGGGTPSKAPAFVFESILQAARRLFRRRLSDVEVTAEANPESLTSDVVAQWVALGINRVSVGLQSLDEPVLKYLGRLYNPAAYANVLDFLTKNGIRNFNADFITGVPGQSIASTLADLEFAVDRGVTHLSLYQLTLEPGTLLKNRVDAGKASRPQDTQQIAQMDAGIEYLSQRGFSRYEISNFAAPGNECRHNLLYWTGRPYLGVGVSAHMFTGRRRFFQPRSLDAYMAGDSLRQDAATSARDILINQLRLKRYFPLRKISGIFPPQSRAAAERIINLGIQREWITSRENSLALTDLGLKFSDSLIAELWAI